MNRIAAMSVMIALISCSGGVAKDSSTTTDSSGPPKLAVDTIRIAAYEDSLLDTLSAGRSAVTRAGDTLVRFGGGMLDGDYGASRYQKNAAKYVRIARLVGHKPDGRPIWSTRARLRLPPMDSTQGLFYAGMCGINDKGDPYILAIPAPGPADSVYRDIRHAWRFDRSAETLREIPSSTVVCWDVGED